MTEVGDRLREALRRRTAGAGAAIPPVSTVVDGARRRRRRSRAMRTGAFGAVVAITLTVVLMAANRSPSVRTAVDSSAPTTGTGVTESSTSQSPSTKPPPSESTPATETPTTFGLGQGRVNPMSDPLVLLDAQHLVWIATSSDGERRALVSSDAGAHWKATLQMPIDQYGGVVGRASSVWILGRSMAWSSSDSGLTWHQETLPAGGLALVRIAPSGVVGLTPKGELIQRVGDQPWSSVPQGDPFVDICPTASGGYIGISDSGVWASVDGSGWTKSLPAPTYFVNGLICARDRIVATAGNCGFGHCQVQSWVSRDDGASWTDITPPPYDLADPNNPLTHTSGYGPIGAAPDESTWFHAYSILEPDQGAFNLGVSGDDGKSLTRITFAPTKPPDVTYLDGPGGFATLDSRTAWVVLNHWSSTKSTDVLYVTHDQGRTWYAIQSDSVH